MAPKKVANNPYFFFMLHLQNQNNGRKKNMRDINLIAGPLWEKMSAEQRAPFVAMAKKAKNSDAGERYTSQGVSFTEVQLDKEREKEKLETMRRDIKNLIELNVNNNSLETQNFFFIDFNIFCEYYEKNNDERIAIPAEVAIVKYSLESGVHDFYHTCINPGELPIGYKFDAREYSEQTHQLPIASEAIGEEDKRKILHDIVTFLSKDLESGSLPFLFTMYNNYIRVEKILQRMCEEEDVYFDFKVYDISELFMHLLNVCTDDEYNRIMAQMHLDKDTYWHFNGESCSFHETTEVMHMCSLSKAKRWAYIISDYCCQHIGISLIPGKHVPHKAAVDERIQGSRSSSRAESVMMDKSAVHTAPRAVSPTTSVASSYRPTRDTTWDYVDNVKTKQKNERGINRPSSPTETMLTSMSEMTLTDSKRFVDAKEYVPIYIKKNDSAFTDGPVTHKPGEIMQIRRPNTVSMVSKQATKLAATGSAASALGYSSDANSGTDNEWQPVKFKGKGAGRGKKTTTVSSYQ